MIRLFLSLLAATFLFTPISAETPLPHLRLDLPSTVEELEERYRSARAHITPQEDAKTRSRDLHRATIQSGLAARSDAWFQDPAAAREAREACALGDQDGCVSLAQLAIGEAQTLPDEPLAYALAILACEAGHYAGCVLFVERDWSYFLTEHETLFPATDRFHEGCADGDAEQCYWLGRIWSGYHSHHGVEQDPEKGQAFFKLGCELGSDAACGLVQPPKLSPEEAFADAMEGCANGDGAHCYSVGYSYVMGRGVERDTPKGLDFLGQACGSGYGHGCFFTARLYEEGRHVPADAGRALAYHDRACDAGWSQSCTHLAGLYADGLGVPQSSEKAEAYRAKDCKIRGCAPEILAEDVLAELQDSLSPIVERHRETAAEALQACLRDDAAACFGLAEVLGRGGDKRAAPLMRHACDLGSGAACVEVGKVGHSGRGLVAFQRACDLGHLPGCTLLVLRDRARSPEDRRMQLDALCDRAAGSACLALGEAHAGSAHVDLAAEQSEPRALEYWQRACGLETFRACAHLAFAAHPDQGGDFDRMMVLLEDTCARGGASACDRIGFEYSYAKYVERDLETARAFFLRACRIATGAEDCPDAERLRLILERRDLRTRLGGFEAALVERPEDFRLYFQAPARRVRAACAAGQVDQCIALAGFYQTYEAPAQDGRDDDHARGIYGHLCEAGDPEACYRFGYSHENRGHESRHDFSLTYFDRGCALGHGAACKAAGFLYELGDDATGGVDDHERAGAYYLRACGLGHARGCRGLSSLFDVGEPKKSAFDLVACLGGNGQACGFIADDYRKGRRSVPEDRDMARALYGHGCAFGDEGACHNHRRLGGG